MDANRARRCVYASVGAVLSVLSKLGEQDFARVQSLIFDYAGITLAAGKKQLAENRLSRQLRLTTFTDFSTYLTAVVKDPVLKQGFISALTTNVTSFYREAHHFEMLVSTLRRFVTRENSTYAPRIWSAGCSTGEEAISILFTVLDSLSEAQASYLLLKGQAMVLATDIDTAVLATAGNAIYSSAQVKSLPAKWLARAFEKIDESNYKLRPEFKSLIKFHPINLNAPHWIFPSNFGNTRFDAIFCRNVMIYFNAVVQRKLLLKFLPYLHSNSLFFSGHSEMLLHSSDLFESLGCTAYRPKNNAYTAHQS